MKKIYRKSTKLLQNPSIYLLLVFIFVTAAITFAQTEEAPANPEETFSPAGDFYQKAEYEQAANLYQKLADAGYESGNLYYNLGNSYFKLQQKGLAVLYYERAKRLIPTDKNLQINLTYALDGVKEGEINWGAEFFRNLAYLAPLNLLTVISSGLFFLVIILISLMQVFSKYIKNKETGKYRIGWKISLFATGALFIMAFMITAITYFDHHQPQAVFIEDEAKIYVEANTSAGITYNLTEGARVYVLEAKNDWYLIKRRDGKRGWVEKSYLEKI